MRNTLLKLKILCVKIADICGWLNWIDRKAIAPFRPTYLYRCVECNGIFLLERIGTCPRCQSKVMQHLDEWPKER